MKLKFPERETRQMSLPFDTWLPAPKTLFLFAQLHHAVTRPVSG